ncbi:MAG: hypothetical protein JW976_09755 [Syntrophaceae bacterium]|nr:hypothetical protein [Syntrophaceae bacterium]
MRTTLNIEDSLITKLYKMKGIKKKTTLVKLEWKLFLSWEAVKGWQDSAGCRDSWKRYSDKGCN